MNIEQLVGVELKVFFFFFFISLRIWNAKFVLLRVSIFWEFRSESWETLKLGSGEGVEDWGGVVCVFATIGLTGGVGLRFGDFPLAPGTATGFCGKLAVGAGGMAGKTGGFEFFLAGWGIAAGIADLVTVGFFYF